MCQEIEAGIKRKGEMCYPSILASVKLNIRLLKSVSSIYSYIFNLLKNLTCECTPLGTRVGVVENRRLVD